MPIPVIAAGGILAGIAQIIVTYRIVSILVKVATRVMIFGLIVGVFLLILAAIGAIIDGLTVVTPDVVLVAYSWLVPSNFYACLSAIATVQIIIWAWHWKMYAIDFTSKGVS